MRCSGMVLPRLSHARCTHGSCRARCGEVQRSLSRCAPGGILGKSQTELKTFLRLLLPLGLSFCHMACCGTGQDVREGVLARGTAAVKEGQGQEEGASHA